MNRRWTIFCFWEPRGAMPAYLRLCMKTWQRRFTEGDVVLLDYSNLAAYVPPGVLDLEVLRKLRPMVQKDAVMVAVLHAQGGVFLDADTIVAGDIRPLTDRLDHTEMVMFNAHLACIAARPGARILARWLEQIQGRLHGVRTAQDSRTDDWDFLGNSLLSGVMDSLIADIPLAGTLQRAVVSPALGALEATLRNRQRDARLAASLRAMNHRLVFRSLLRRHLHILDRVRHGFIPEADHFRSRTMPSKEKYERFWFDAPLQVEDVFRKHPSLVGLHNSWTPDWYRRLDEHAVLRHHCLLSRTLKQTLAEVPATR
jgi:hypothetical protein